MNPEEIQKVIDKGGYLVNEMEIGFLKCFLSGPYRLEGNRLYPSFAQWFNDKHPVINGMNNLYFKTNKHYWREATLEEIKKYVK